MERIFFTADLHLGHKNIMEYCQRDFRDVHHMNKMLTELWNDTVGENDWIAILGDLTMKQQKIPEYLGMLHGKKVYVPGNHDHRAESYLRRHEEETGEKLVEKCSPLVERKVGEHRIIMCHYAMRVWNKSHHGAIQLYGHSHDGLPPLGRQLDVGVDSAKRLVGEYRPMSLEEILKFVPDKISTPDKHGKDGR